MTKSLYSVALASVLALAGCGVGNKVEEKKAAQPTKQTLVVVNVLDPELYNDAHIKGSINVPFDKVEDYLKNTAHDTELVFYCANYACSASGAAAEQAKAAGFSKVWAYEGGMAEWISLGYPYEGPAKEEYIKSENKKPDHLAEFAISAEDLKNKMHEHKILS